MENVQGEVLIQDNGGRGLLSRLSVRKKSAIRRMIPGHRSRTEAFSLEMSAGQ
jgi:hypothetical protein